MKLQTAGILLWAVLGLALAPSASAQGCAMCYNAAASQDPKAQKAIDAAIFTLVSPIFLLAGGVVFVAYKRRNAPDDGDDNFSSESAPADSTEFSQPRVLCLPIDFDSSDQARD